MNDHNDEDLLALYQASRQEQPSELLDRRIRGAASNALKIRRRSPWLWGLSTAAVLVLSFSVVLQLYFDESRVDDFAELPEPAAEAPAAAPMPSSAPPPETDARPEAEFDAAERTFTRLKKLEVMPQVVQNQAPPRKLEEPKLQTESTAVSGAYLDAAELADLEEQSMDSLGQLAATAPPAPSMARLPLDAEALAALAPQLIVEQTASGLTTVYHDNKLILSLKSAESAATFKAWPGAERLGIEIDWTLTPARLSDCRDGPVYRICAISPGVSGYFEGERLDHIEWLQRNDPR